jgi:hypothetical protein
VRALLVELPGHRHVEAARAPAAPSRSPRLPLRAPGRGHREARRAPADER